MITVNKVFCCLDLKIGILIIGIVDILFCGIGSGYGGICEYCHIFAYIFFILHIIGCILLIVSFFMPDKKFVYLYLVTCIVRIIYLIFSIIYMAINGYFGVEYTILCIISIGFGIYFWICVYSWLRRLGGSVE